ncbi:hypothetical protein ACP_3403 [Acidobacterium capsulatum ATCC 51196]|uniref:Uncharacterized protein n=2 Tax=Acidobacteriaceae TaxID=204434 RepID=C1F6G9_ACIC5|nr:hypothetical protein ACP_3403 [Acidobacterium capsulatum ATCC 51196]
MILAVSGCARISSGIKMEPQYPPQLSLGTVSTRLQGDWSKRYHNLLDKGLCPDDSGNGVAALASVCPDGLAQQTAIQLYRNEILDSIRAEIDIRYREYISGLRAGQVYSGLFGDLATLGLTTSATLVGADDLKAILTGTATATQGGVSSIDKRMFESQTIQAIIPVMDGNRARVAVIMQAEEKETVQNYTLESGLSDLNDYFMRGTLLNALQSMAAAGGQKQNSADNQKATGLNLNLQ